MLRPWNTCLFEVIGLSFHTLQIISRLLMRPKCHMIIIVICCSKNCDRKKSLHTFSMDVFFFLNVFDQCLIDSQTQKPETWWAGCVLQGLERAAHCRPEVAVWKCRTDTVDSAKSWENNIPRSAEKGVVWSRTSHFWTQLSAVLQLWKHFIKVLSFNNTKQRVKLL